MATLHYKMEPSSQRDEYTDDGLLHENHLSKNLGKKVRSHSCYASSFTHVSQRLQTRNTNGDVNIIDLTSDDAEQPSLWPRRTKSQPLKIAEISRARRFSKFLANKRTSIAAISNDLIGDGGKELSKLFSKGTDKNGGYPLQGHSEEEEEQRQGESTGKPKQERKRKGSINKLRGRNSSPNTACSNTEVLNDDKIQRACVPELASEDWESYTLTPHRSSLLYTIPFDYFCKVLLLGDSGVGKTCLLMKFKDGAFLSGSYISTVGIDFRNKVISVDNSKVKLQIWDTAGQERFRSVTHAYYRDAHALLLLYDVTNKSSFDNTREWLAEVHEYAQDDVVIMLIGNKCDVPTSERQIRREDGERLAREYNVAFMETSAKTGLNVDLAFTAVARDLKARKSNSIEDKKFNVAEYVEKQERIDHCMCSLS